MKVNLEEIKKLRSKTSAGIEACREALEASDGDQEKAIEYLRKKGVDKASKRAEREASEGVIGYYVHGEDQKIVALVEVNSETDFVARTDEFKEFAHDLAMQVAAMNPLYVSRDDVPKDVLEKEKEIIEAEFKDSGKPKEVVEKIVEGKLKTFYEEECLLEQKFFKDDKKKISDLLMDMVAKIGEKIEVRRFVRMAVGE